MNNSQVARFLERIGKLLEIAGANNFKVRAFERAAEAVEALAEPIATIAERGELTRIEGIGKSIAEDIAQLLERGTCSAWEELTQTLPASLLDLLELQGIGPKKVAVLHSELGVTDLESLRAVANEGRIPTLKGFSKKTEEKILAELDRLASMAGRTPLGQAMPLAEALRQHLLTVEGVEQVVVAGSMRRWAETVGDLDFVALVRGPSMPAMDALVAWEETDEVLAHGPSKTSVRLKSGIQADLRVFEPELFGSAVHHFTGSKFHHIELRLRAQKLGLKISEYGVHRVDSGELVAGSTEAEVYRSLNLPWIPPELREGRGEVAAAEAGTLPDLIEVEHIRGDLHMHTEWSDGAASIEDMARAALDRGYEYICITDHSRAVTVANGLTPERILAQIQAVREVDAKVDGIRVFAGCECDILKDGTLDLPDDILDQLDWVVGSVHSAMSLPRDEMTARVVRAIESGRIDAVGHPTGRMLGHRPGYELDLDVIIEAARKHGVALEVNASPNRLDLNDLLVRRARDAGVRIVISSDAHSPNGLSVLPFGVHTARRGWVERSDVLNALPLAEFEAWLATR